MSSSLLIEGIKEDEQKKFEEFAQEYEGENLDAIIADLKTEYKYTKFFDKSKKENNILSRCYELKYKNKSFFFDFGDNFKYFAYHVSKIKE